MPPYFREVFFSSCENFVKIDFKYVSSIPIPVSIIDIKISCLFEYSFIKLHFKTTEPISVNFKELPIKLNKICSILRASPFKTFEIEGSILFFSSIFFSLAFILKICNTLFINVSNPNSTFSISISPASILEISKTLLIIDNK